MPLVFLYHLKTGNQRFSVFKGSRENSMKWVHLKALTQRYYVRILFWKILKNFVKIEIPPTESLFSKFESANEVPQSQIFSYVYILQNLLEHLSYCFIDDLWNDFMILQVQKWYSFMSCFINKNYSLCKFCYYIYLWLCWKTFSYRVLFIQYSVVSVDF